jgi:hypothetical protein
MVVLEVVEIIPRQVVQEFLVKDLPEALEEVVQTIREVVVVLALRDKMAHLEIRAMVE